MTQKIMFHTARLKLTGWYLLIIMLISMLFSVAIYAMINQEYMRIERGQRARYERIAPWYESLRQQREEAGLPVPTLPPMYDPNLVDEARTRLLASLVFVNLGILSLAGVAGYFLAGLTLKPIQEMVENQQRFIADASHELRTPLTALKTEIEVALRSKKLSAKEAYQLLSSNLEEVDHLEKLAQALLTLTRYQKGRKRAEFTTVPIGDVIEAAWKKVTPMAKQKSIEFSSNLSSKIVYGDEKSLVELFVILFDNAIKYSEPKTTVTVTAKQTDHNLNIKVADQGFGIAKEDLPRIFERFYRVDASRNKATADGYGLGLSIAQHIVADHKGKISAESKVGAGTTIAIILPTVG